jgi:hypothetical protein
VQQGDLVRDLRGAGSSLQFLDAYNHEQIHPQAVHVLGNLLAQPVMIHLYTQEMR